MKANKSLCFDFDENLRTALHFAVSYCEIAIVKLILELYPNVNHRDRKARTPLFYAMRRRSKSIIILLMKHRADIDDVCLGNFEGWCEKSGLFEFYKFIKEIRGQVKLVSSKRRWHWWWNKIERLDGIDGLTFNERNFIHGEGRD